MQNDSSQKSRDDIIPNFVTKIVSDSSLTSLHQAVVLGDEKAVELLLSTGADRNAKDLKHGNTPLHEAAWRGYSRCIKILCALPKSSALAVDKRDLSKSKQTKVALQNTQGALHSALLGTRNAGGFSALHLAAQNGHNQSCREILLAGANPDVQNNYGDTPLHTACRYGHAGATRILLSAACDPLRINLNGDTALHIACAMGRRKLTRILLQAESSTSLKLRNAQDETARNIAFRKKLMEIVEILDAAPPTTPATVNERSNPDDRAQSSSSSKQNKKDEKHKRMRVKDTEETAAKTGAALRASTSPQTSDEKKVLNWSPYGCHYFPDPRSFPSPKLETLPKEPLNSGEQYFLDLAGNIKKGPVGVGNTCYCGPFFRHIEQRISRNKKSMKKFVHKATEKLDNKVQALAMKTDDQIEQITRSMMADRIRCSGRRLHLEHWLKRGDQLRATVAPHTSRHGKHDSEMNTLTRCRSLEFLDSDRVVLRSDHITPSNLHRSVDVLDHEVIVHRSADDLDMVRSNSVERSSNLTENDRNSGNMCGQHRDTDAQYRPRQKPSGCDRLEVNDEEKFSSEYSRELIGLARNEDKLSVAERLEELLSKTNEIIQMERIARCKRREGLAMLSIKRRPPPSPQQQPHTRNVCGLKALSTSQYGSGSGASADDDGHMKKFTRLDYRRPDSCSIESASIAHEMKRITSSLLDNIGHPDERIIIGKEDDLLPSPRYSRELESRGGALNVSQRSEDERSDNQFQISMTNSHRKMTPTGLRSEEYDESDLSEDNKGHFLNEDNIPYDRSYDDAQYYQSDEVDADVRTNPKMHMSSINCGFYQNTFFNDSKDVSSSDTIDSIQQAKDAENANNSAGEDVDLRYDLPQMANTKDLHELKNRILNGAHWRSQVLRKSAQDANKISVDDKKLVVGAYSGAAIARAQGTKISELVARLQGHTMQPTFNMIHSENDSESSEDELDVDTADVVQKPLPLNTLPTGKSPLPNPVSLETIQQPVPFAHNRAQPQVAKTIQSQSFNAPSHIDTRSLIPKDAYFHELPNKSHSKSTARHCQPEPITLHMIGRNRNPLPLNMNTDGDILTEQIAVQRLPTYLGHDYLPSLAHNSLIDGQYPVHGMVSVAMNNGTLPIMGQTLNSAQMQAMVEHRDMNNDSGYSNSRVCGSSHGPSPSLSGQTDSESAIGHPSAMINPPNAIQNGASPYLFASVAASSLV